MRMRKWSVRKLRRRPRSCDNNKNRSYERRARSASSKLKAVSSEEEDNVEKSSSSPSVSLEVNEKQEIESDEKNSSVKTDLLLFGSDFDKQPLADTIDLSSDQDSTGGEDNDIVGKNFF